MISTGPLGEAGRFGGLPPRRISFNFADRCNMSCRFCYIPFDGMRANAAQAAEVIDTILRWGPTAITVGGGDPLMYRYTLDLLTRIHRTSSGVRPFVQLDSNFAHRRVNELLPELATLVDMVGVPLDTLTPDIAHVMRGDRGYPDRIRFLLPRLAEHGFCVKINTVVSNPNVKQLPELADFVAGSGVQVWSLYEFWEIGDTAKGRAELFSLSREIFLHAVEGALRRAPRVHIETGSVDSRLSAYFFVTPFGRAYTVRNDDRSRYVELGNVLTDEALVVEKWHKHADISANEMRVRRRRSIAESGRGQ